MEKIEKTSQELPFIKKPDIFKIIITEPVEKKIRFLCNSLKNIEWSGVLFYRISGAFEDDSLTISCIDIFQMDIGASTYTEFTMSPDVIAYMTSHPELLEKGVYQGLIHSHHNMSTFFSGTDLNTLKSEGKDTHHFVSLIVNNEGTYTARITRKCKIRRVCEEVYYYTTWENEVKESVEASDKEEEVLEWFDLAVTVESLPIEDEELVDRLNELKAIKARTQLPVLDSRPPKKARSLTGTSGNFKEVGGVYPMEESKFNYSKTIEDAPYYSSWGLNDFKVPDTDTSYDTDIPYDKVKVHPDIVQTAVRQLLTGNIFTSIRMDSGTWEKWVNSMDSFYSKRFGDLIFFKEFAVNYLDFLISNTFDEDVMDIIDNDDSVMMALLAYDVKKALSSELPKSHWVNVYIELLEDYIY